MRFLKIAGSLALLFWTWCILVYHIGVLPPPTIDPSDSAEAEWIDKKEMGIHQLILSGDAYSRGLKAGRLTSEILRQQEQDLTAQLFRIIPEPAMKILEIPLIRYFWGAEKFVEPWMLQEMYGVSKSAPQEFNRLIDGYTRQFAYHGLHEVGQMMVDQGGEDMGCTVVAVRAGKNWVLGRNFDFEGGRILDSEKIMKWVYPRHGYAYVSVIWAGMVGAVTAINEHGLYMSLNAGGSSEYRRFGMPTTLLLAKTMREAKTAQEAIKILERQPTFITDIFVLFDTRAGRLYRIEKSPLNMEVLPLKGPTAISNHLVSEHFKNDHTNLMRQAELTTIHRSERGEELVEQLAQRNFRSGRELERPILNILRDKAGLNLGNRRAIDALIATHAVVYNAEDEVLFVNRGPGLAGEFIGFDLKTSFRTHHPVVARTLPRDPQVSDEMFARVHESALKVSEAAKALRRRQCPLAEAALKEAVEKFSDSPNYHLTLGDFKDECAHDKEGAIQSWRKALSLTPAYAREGAHVRAQLKKNGVAL